MFPSQLLRISLRRKPHINIPRRSIKQLPLENNVFKTRTRLLVHAVAQGTLTNSRVLQTLLRVRKIEPEIFEIWVDILRNGDLVSGLMRLGLLESGGEGRIRLECPDWLFLTLPGLLKVGQSQYLISILLSARFDQLPSDDQALFIARSIQHLLKIKDYVAVRELVEWVCWYENEITSARAFEKFLVALTSFRGRSDLLSSPPKELLHSLAQMLRETMKERKIEPTLNIFWSLFHPALISHDSKKAYELLVEIKTLGMPLEKGILESMLRIFAKNNQPILADEILSMLEQSVENKQKAERARSAAEEEIKRKKEIRKAMGRHEGLKFDAATALERRLERVKIEDELVKEILSEDQSPLLLSTGQKKKLKAKARKGALEELAFTSFEPIVPTILTTVTDSPIFNKPRQKYISKLIPLDLPPLPTISNLRHATTFLGSLKLDPPAALEYFDQHRNTADQLDGPNWTAILQITALAPTISTESLMELFRKVQASRSGKSNTISGRLIRGTTRKYTILLKGLLLRSEFELAMEIWKECLDRRDVRPDVMMLNVILEAFILGGNIEGGEALINYFAILKEDSQLSRFGSNVLHKYAKPHSIPIDITILNTLLSAYNRAGRYTKVYDLFKTLESNYGLVPDAATISVLLDTARYASAAAGNGWGPGDQMIPSSFDGPGTERDKNDNWNGNSAHEVASSIMWNILETSWPEVEKCLIDPGKEVLGAGFLKWWKGTSDNELQSVEGGVIKKRGEGKLARTITGELGKPFSATLSISPPVHPSIYPTPRLFRSFIQLLGFHSTSDSISIALAWMRAIGSTPDRSTVLLALLYLGEGGFGERKRERIRTWLVDWLGEEMVPDEIEVAKARRGSRGRRGF